MHHEPPTTADRPCRSTKANVAPADATESTTATAAPTGQPSELGSTVLATNRGRVSPTAGNTSGAATAPATAISPYSARLTNNPRTSGCESRPPPSPTARANLGNATSPAVLEKNHTLLARSKAARKDPNVAIP